MTDTIPPLPELKLNATNRSIEHFMARDSRGDLFDLETHLYDEHVAQNHHGEVVPANRCSCNPLPDDGPCGAAVGTSVCGRVEADPVHDPFAPGSGATASGHQFVPLAAEHLQHIEAA